MKLQHSLGGMEGLEIPSFEKRVFVQPWEKIIFAIHVAMMGLSKHLGADGVRTAFNDEWTWADLRKGAEAMNPFDYFKYRYYEKWLGGISSFFVGKGYISDDELQERTEHFLEGSIEEPAQGGDPSIDAQVIRYLETGDSPLRDNGPPPKFGEGDTVTVKDVPPGEHTRLPGHLRGRQGTVEKVYPGSYAYFCSTGPDGLGAPMPSYCVRFDPKHVWGDTATEPGVWFYADLFETYLD